MRLPFESNRYLHLLLLRHEMNPERRKQPSPQGSSGRPRPQAAAEIEEKLAELQEEQRQRPSTPGFQPHLVFRVPLAKGASQEAVADALHDVGAIIVSYEPDRAVIAFYEDADLSAFHDALQQYSAGPRSGINPQTKKPYESTKWDVFGYIQADQMRNWSREDRIGMRLREEIGADGRGIEVENLYYLDVEFWPRGQQQARADLAELRGLLQRQPHPDERIHDEFPGDLMCLARVAITGAKLDTLLNLSSVAEVDRPPQPTFDAFAASVVTPGQFPTPAAPPEDGPRVCIVDSGITSNHPLLRNHVGHEEAILTDAESPADGNGHGTRVGGVAVFGDVRAAYDAGLFMSEVMLFSARVLNDDNEFDQRRLVERQMEEAIKTFAAPPYNCRVFNLSIGDRTPLLRGAADRQGRWAEALDRLMREHRVLIVVAAGNHRLAGARRPDDAEQVLQDYPDFLFDPDAGLCEPATAALAVTVGSLAQYEVAAIQRGSQEHDIVRPVARRNEPSPFTRIGLGVKGAVKPEFVGYGGNVGFYGTGASLRFIHDEIPDPGLAVMSLSSQPLQKLFDYGIGTSYAAPHLARLAAGLWIRLREDLNEEPHPNLIRAVLASSAEVPDEARALLGDEKAIRQVCGYGLPDEDLAFNSTDRRVTLVAQAKQHIDTITLYEIPILAEMIEAPGRKRIIVSLAFDPPVRRRRANYLGVKMRVDLLRGKSPEEIEASYKAVSKEERKTAPKSFEDRHLCKLQPGPKALDSSTLQRREWRFKRGDLKDGDTYYLMIRSFRTWAPDEVTVQDYALAVTLEAESDRLYNLISQRVRQRPRQRQRVRG